MTPHTRAFASGATTATATARLHRLTAASRARVVWCDNADGEAAARLDVMGGVSAMLRWPLVLDDDDTWTTADEPTRALNAAAAVWRPAGA